ncbi:MAG TPA: YsnF/AvaK domain-containing protein [Longimicrobiaceae bacterium]|nr:YsnF/AvaK domain-containing protein [Longimicrobiaceae bacterium]
MSINERDREVPLERDRTLRDDQAERDARLTLSEEELAVGKRRMEAGEVEIDKRVETRHVSEQVPLSHDEVTIERRPIEPGMHASARIAEEEIRVPLSEEEAVVQKRVVPKEELVVRKQQVEETEMVEADLRRERVDVDTEGDVRERR